MVTTSELDRIVLQAVSDDYESFDSLVNKLSRLGSFICGVYEGDEVERSLPSCIAKRFVVDYLLHADPSVCDGCASRRRDVRKYWYRITEEGKEYLRGVS